MSQTDPRAALDALIQQWHEKARGFEAHYNRVAYAAAFEVRWCVVRALSSRGNEGVSDDCTPFDHARERIFQ